MWHCTQVRLLKCSKVRYMTDIYVLNPCVLTEEYYFMFGYLLCVFLCLFSLILEKVMVPCAKVEIWVGKCTEAVSYSGFIMICTCFHKMPLLAQPLLYLYPLFNEVNGVLLFFYFFVTPSYLLSISPPVLFRSLWYIESIL